MLPTTSAPAPTAQTSHLANMEQLLRMAARTLPGVRAYAKAPAALAEIGRELARLRPYYAHDAKTLGEIEAWLAMRALHVGLLARLTPELIDDLLWVYTYESSDAQRGLLRNGEGQLIELGFVEKHEGGPKLTPAGYDVAHELRHARRAA